MSLSLPPGPRGHFLIGSLPEFKRDMLGFFTGLARDYGGFVGFHLMHVPCVLINEPALIEELLVRNESRLSKSWDVRKLSAMLGRGLLTAEGETWKRERRLIQPAFHPERIRHYARIMSEEAERIAAAWRDGDTRDIHADMMRVTLAIVARALFGESVEAESQVIADALDAFMHWFERLLTGVPLPLAVPSPTNLRVRRALRRLDAVVYGLIAKRRREGTAGRADLLSWLLDARDEQGEGISDRQIRDEVATFILAGHETTALALSWTLMLLAQHPEAEARLHAELTQVLGGRVPGYEDYARLPWTRQVVQESMRLYPPAWGLGRETLEEITLGGYRLPRGTQVMPIQWVTHRDARFFPEPDRFRPERWAPDAPAAIPKFAYFPFGAGPRSCIGNGFAMVEAVLLLAVFASHARFALVEPQTIELQPAVTLRPRHGINVRIQRT